MADRSSTILNAARASRRLRTLVLRPSQRQAALVFFASLLFALLCRFEWVAGTTAFARQMGLAGLIFFGGGGLLVLILFAARRPLLKLDSSGFTISARTPLSVMWHEVTKPFAVWEYPAPLGFRGQKMVTYAIARSPGVLGLVSVAVTGEMDAALPDTYGMAAEDLADLMNYYWREALSPAQRTHPDTDTGDSPELAITESKRPWVIVPHANNLARRARLATAAFVGVLGTRFARCVNVVRTLTQRVSSFRSYWHRAKSPVSRRQPVAQADASPPPSLKVSVPRRPWIFKTRVKTSMRRAASATTAFGGVLNTLGAEIASKQRALAAQFGGFRPWATAALIILMIAIFIEQRRVFSPRDFFSLVDSGANAPVLVATGQWFRLITANLLSASTLSLFLSVLSMLIIGGLAESRLGARRFLLIVLVTSINAQLASVLVASLFGLQPVYLCGISGALFGLLGALAVVHWWHRAKGEQFSRRALALFGLALIGMALPIAHSDIAARLGGFASGILLGWLSSVGKSADGMRRSPGILTNGALAITAFCWIAAIGLAALHLSDPVARQADQLAILDNLVEAPNPNPELDNQIVRAIATGPSNDMMVLNDARSLVSRAIIGATVHDGPEAMSTKEGKNTLALVYDRLGETGMALDVEEPLMAAPTPETPSLFMAFLERNMTETGVRRLGGTNLHLPTVKTYPALSSPGKIGFDVSFAGPLTHASTIYALVHDGAQLRGLMRLNLLPMPYTFVRATLPASAFNGTAVTLDLAEFDTSGCRCTASGVDFFAYDPKIGALIP